MSKLESQIEREILLAFGARDDLKVWKSKPYPAIDPRTGKRIGGLALPEGHPDIAGVLKLDGGFCAPLMIEVKSETGRVRLEQARFAAMLKHFGACYALARSPADVQKAIDEYRAAHLLRLRPKPIPSQAGPEGASVPQLFLPTDPT